MQNIHNCDPSFTELCQPLGGPQFAFAVKNS